MVFFFYHIDFSVCYFFDNYIAYFALVASEIDLYEYVSWILI